jgi:xylulokinase
VLLPKDYVRLRLTGELAIDAADASGTLLFDVERRAWSERVLEALEIPLEWLPRVLESPQVSGRTSADVPVAAGAGDQQAGALGVGVVRPGPLSVVLGTSGVVFAALDRYAHDREARVHVFCHAVPGVWEAMGVMLSAAGSLRWLRDTLSPGVDYEQLTAEAAHREPGVEGLLFLPYLQGERTPHADPNARGAFSGLSLVHDRGSLVRAVLEGVAFGLKDSLELTAVEEGAAYGAALLGGVASGVFSDAEEAVRACVRVRDRVEPNPDWQETYERGHIRFRALYPALRSLEEKP